MMVRANGLRQSVPAGTDLTNGLRLSRGDLGAFAETRVTFRHSQTDTLATISDKASSAGGLWWDYDNTLLASLLLDDSTHRFLALNVYPGVLKIAGGQLGLWFTLDHARKPYFGITGRRSLGLGLGVGF